MEIICTENNTTYYIAVDVNTNINQKWLEIKKDLEHQKKAFDIDYFVGKPLDPESEWKDCLPDDYGVWEPYLPTDIKLCWNSKGYRWNDVWRDYLNEATFLSSEICNLINFDWDNDLNTVETVENMNKIITFCKNFETTTNGEYRFTIEY